MNRWIIYSLEQRMLSIFAFTFALCSIAYELLLGQTLSAFLGNTVLRYSVTIGLYMMSMGLGALFARKRVMQFPLLSLQYVELFLSLLGGLSLSMLFFVHGLGLEGVVFSGLAHLLIIVIGFLTGLELPLLFAVGQLSRKSGRTIILGVDYIGAFAGTFLFAFFLYPRLGLFASCFLVASMNALMGIGLIWVYKNSEEDRLKVSDNLMAWQSLILFLSIAALTFAAEINSFWLSIYTSSA